MAIGSITWLYLFQHLDGQLTFIDTYSSDEYYTGGILNASFYK